MMTNELKGRIVAAGFSQQSLATAMSQQGCKISKNTLSKKVNGQAIFGTDEVICLCDLLGIHDNDEKAYIFLT